MGWHFRTFPTASWSSGLATHWTDWQRRPGWRIALFIIGVILTLTAMLDRLRAYFPRTRSLLMDQQTLLAHRALWVREQSPHGGSLSRLDLDERALFEELAGDRHGLGVRLEQERIPFGWVRKALSALY